MNLKTQDYMKFIAVTALVLSAGMAVAELEGAMIVFGICGFILIILLICYH